MTQNAVGEVTGVFEQLKALPVAELRKLKARADSLIVSKEDAEKEQALDQIEKLAEQAGLSADEVRRRLDPPKYIHPADPTKIWSGRGKMAKWLQDERATGRNKEDFLNPSYQKNRQK